MQYAYRGIMAFPHYFSATTGWNSMELYGNYQYNQEEIRISSACSGQTL
jgi:hypothetical protein